MTIATNDNKTRALGNDSTTEFSYDFYVKDLDHLKVIVADASDNQTVLVRDTDYSVVQDADYIGGTITYPISGSPLATGSSITMYRELPITQTTDFRNQGGFHSERHEDLFDYLTMVMQQIDEELNRTYTVSITSGDTGEEVYTKTQTDASIDADVSAHAALTTGVHGLGTMSQQNLGAVNIDGGAIDGVTIGAAAAPTVNNLGSVATCDINGGTIDGTVIGGNTPAAATVTELVANGTNFKVDASGNVTSNNLSNPNILINSDGSNPIDQRGALPATSVTNGDYTADRKKVEHNCTQVDVAVQSGGGLRVTCTTAGAGTYYLIGELVEDYAQYVGKVMTLSAKVKSNDSGAKLRLTEGVANKESSTHTGGGGWEVLSVTGTIQAGATSLGAYMLSLSPSDTKYIEYEWIKLEEGAVATPWTVPDPAEELARCQRYYWKLVDGNSKYFGVGAYDSTLVHTFVLFPVSMRTVPSLVVATGTDYYAMQYNGSADTFNSLTISNSTTEGARIYNNTEVSPTGGGAGLLITNNASASIAFESELF